MIRSGVLTRKEILSSLSSEKPIEQRLFISPLLDKAQISDTSIDMRLGHRFSVPKPSRMGLLDIIELHNGGESAILQNYDENRVPYGQYFTLHPGSSVQISTLEYLGLPNNLEGIVTLRASISSIPLISNVAQVHPGHRGVITLTLTSNAEFSIKLYPGMRVAELQLRFIASIIDQHKPSRYHYMTRPIPTELYKDTDLEFLGPMVEPIIIGIVSTIAAGRTTAINHLMERHGFSWFSLAQVLKAEAIKLGIPTLRTNLQDFGNNMRELHGDFYLASKLRAGTKWQTNENSLVIVDSFKNIAEIEEFRKQKRFILIGIDAPLEQRWDRVQSRRRQGDPTTLDEFIKQDATDRGIIKSSTHAQQVDKLLEMADRIIHNDTTISDFMKAIDKIVSDLVTSS